MKKTQRHLADGRQIIYYDGADHEDASRDAVDRRDLPRVEPEPQIRYDPLLEEWVGITAHRNARTYHPPADQCPLCPSSEGRPSEIPEHDYDVAVFENRFPSFAGRPGPETEDGPLGLLAHRPGAGRCEVVCFTSDHYASFADLSEERARLVLDAWTDRTAELSRLPGVEQVFCFENRGPEIGVTLGHPHGQIYAYPFTTPRTARMLAAARKFSSRTGGSNLFDEVVASELALGDRVVIDAEHWVAFVPHAAHWPYEVHLYPKPRVPDLPALGEEAREEFPSVYLELLRRFDRIFGDGEPPTPYISGWHQAPRIGRTTHSGEAFGREEFALHLELFTIRRSEGKLKFLAGSESGMNVFVNDVPPEAAARRLREVAS
ncbi:galactose-1-phosphate uridylyltransferase [Streptomyces sulphureus]|uniref:galactose-1-phosphate uridylyltransferase n=1 Tax=Streptomyces sulphureus TaxID=47758 RepID=UPI0003602793|nr:galactose-1-phosphate uridylyltransferase [Streptomyces sulphureus]